jgi:hypothetical protein
MKTTKLNTQPSKTGFLVKKPVSQNKENKPTPTMHIKLRNDPSLDTYINTDRQNYKSYNPPVSKNIARKPKQTICRPSIPEQDNRYDRRSTTRSVLSQIKSVIQSPIRQPVIQRKMTHTQTSRRKRTSITYRHTACPSGEDARSLSSCRRRIVTETNEREYPENSNVKKYHRASSTNSNKILSPRLFMQISKSKNTDQ